jgi:hypothetical protein
VKQRLRNVEKHVQTLPVADIDSENKLLVGKMCAEIKKP